MESFKCIAQSSGFTEDLDAEVDTADIQPVDNVFHDIHEIYVSQAGHTRVFSATRYGKRYALKCLKPDFLYTPVYRQALLKEFEIGLKLDHPGICRTIGMEETKDLGPTIVLELIDGLTLNEVIAKGLLSKDMAAKITEQLIDALEYMHGKQVFHRDLKPSNVMVTHNGHNVKIIDFSLSDSDAFTVLKMPAGTMGYIAPEQLRHDAMASAQGDIFSLGMVIDDMAKATGDHNAMRLAKLCSHADVAKRPSSMGEVRKLAKSGHYGKMVLALVASSLLFACLIAFGINQRASVSKKVYSPAKSSHGDFYQAADSSGNKVVDYKYWQEL